MVEKCRHTRYMYILILMLWLGSPQSCTQGHSPNAGIQTFSIHSRYMYKLSQ